MKFSCVGTFELLEINQNCLFSQSGDAFLSSIAKLLFIFFMEFERDCIVTQWTDSFTFFVLQFTGVVENAWTTETWMEFQDWMGIEIRV